MFVRPRAASLSRQIALGVLVLLGLAASGSGTAAAAPPWTPVGSSLNVGAARSVTDTSMAMVGTTPHAAFLEDGDVYARRWNGTNWVQNGSARLNTTAGAGRWVVTAASGTDLYVAYTELVSGVSNVYVKRWNGTSWASLGGTLNVNSGYQALRPSIAVLGTTPFVTWAEDTSGTNNIYVKQWNGTSWASVGAAAEPTPTRWVYQSAVTGTSASNPIVAVTEWDGTNYDVFVRRWSGTAWATLGTGTINVDVAQSSWQLDAAIQGTDVIVAWAESTGGYCDCRLNVKSWNGSAWSTIGGGPANSDNNASAEKFELVPGSSGPWIAHQRTTTPRTIDVVTWTGTAWKRHGSISTRHLASRIPSMVLVSGVPWVGVGEDDESGIAKLDVRRLNPATGTVGNITNFEVAADTGQASFTWTNPSEADYAGLEIWRSTTEGSLGTLRATIAPPAASWGDSGLTDGTRYFYTFIATDSDGNRRELVWETPESALEPARYGAGVESDGMNVFAFGGYANSLGVRSDIIRYDAASTATSTLAATLSAPRSSASAIWVGGSVNRVVLLGGDGGSATNVIQRFDPATATMTTAAASLPAARAAGAAAYAPNTGRIYYLGGSSSRWAGGTIYGTIYWYDPVTDTSGTESVTLPQPMYRMNAAYWPADGCIYMFGGRTTGETDTNRIVRYCPQLGTAVNMTQTLPAAMSEIAVTRTSRGIVLLGASAAAYQQPIYEFDPFERSFLQHPFPMRMPFQQTTNSHSVAIDDVVYTAASWPQTTKVTQVTLGVVVDVTPSSRPATPSNVAPAAGAAVSSTSPTLTSTAFSDPDAGATHFASHWQLRRYSGSYAAPVIDSGLDVTNLTSMPTSGLTEAERYCFRVRHRDQNRVFSSWSAETCFWVDAAPQDPNAAASLRQYSADGTTAIASGAYTTDGTSTNIVLRFDVSDPDGSQSLTPWVEVRAGATAFSEACGSSLAGVTFAGAAVSPATPGASLTATVNVTGLTAGQDYRWRACARDGSGRSSAWTAKGATPDFRVVVDAAPSATQSTPGAGSTTADTTPAFVATFTDPDTGDTGTVDVEVCTANPGPAQSCTGAGGSLAASGATNSGIVNGSTGSWTSSAFALGTYFWRVRARDQYDIAGAWSAGWQLTIGSPSLTIAVDASAVSLGSLLPGADATGTTTVTITTSNANGYTLSAADGSDTIAASCTAGTCSGRSIPDWTGTGASPTPWTAGDAGTEGWFGATVLAVTGGSTVKDARWGTGATATDFTANRYAGLRSTATTLHSRTSYHSGSDTVTTAYRAIASASGTIAGTYASTISYSVVANP